MSGSRIRPFIAPAVRVLTGGTVSTSSTPSTSFVPCLHSKAVAFKLRSSSGDPSAFAEILAEAEITAGDTPVASAAAGLIVIQNVVAATGATGMVVYVVPDGTGPVASQGLVIMADRIRLVLDGVAQIDNVDVDAFVIY